MFEQLVGANMRKQLQRVVYTIGPRVFFQVLRIIGEWNEWKQKIMSSLHT